MGEKGRKAWRTALMCLSLALAGAVGWDLGLHRAEGSGAHIPMPFPLLALCAAALAACFVYIIGSGKREEELVRRTARTDPLTGLLSVEGFESEVQELLRRYPERRYALVDFDINGFEEFNALYGHEAGNEVLLHMARELRARCTARERSARIEADHFVSLLEEQERPLAERILGFDGAMRTLRPEVTVLISYGVYEVRDAGEPVRVLRDRAIAAKRSVKGNHERFIGVYDEALHRRELEESEMAGAMEAALRQGEFVVYYQPKYSVETEAMIGAEALVRWRRGSGELVQPDRFVPLFERRGLISRLDWYVFERVCRDLKELEASGLEVAPVSVNFSRAHLYDREFAAKIGRAVERSGVRAELLEIELTESVFLEDLETLNRVLEELHGIGLTASIDDFGSGFSSLTMLRSSSFDTVKMDRGFLCGSGGSERERLVLGSVVKLAEALRLKTVAEGVETAEQLRFLREIGCGAAQGFYFCRPEPLGRFASRLPPRAEPAQQRQKVGAER